MLRKIAMAMACSILVGCGSEQGATVKLQFVNTAITARSFQFPPNLIEEAVRAAGTAPSLFKMKLIAAYITEDIAAGTGNNIGQTAMFYLNPDCADDIMHCDISAGTAEDGAAYSHIVTSFFDFAQSSTAVNTALNAQGRSVTPGTYKYARMEFCKTNSANEPNIHWGAVTNTDVSFQRNQCTVNSAAFTTPLVIAAGGTATVSLAYDYSTAVTTGSSATGDSCAGSGTTKECFTLPNFVPSAN